MKANRPFGLVYYWLGSQGVQYDPLSEYEEHTNQNLERYHSLINSKIKDILISLGWTDNCEALPVRQLLEKLLHDHSHG